MKYATKYVMKYANCHLLRDTTLVCVAKEKNFSRSFSLAKEHLLVHYTYLTNARIKIHITVLLKKTTNNYTIKTITMGK